MCSPYRGSIAFSRHNLGNHNQAKHVGRDGLAEYINVGCEDTTHDSVLLCMHVLWRALAHGGRRHVTMVNKLDRLCCYWGRANTNHVTKTILRNGKPKSIGSRVKVASNTLSLELLAAGEDAEPMQLAWSNTAAVERPASGHHKLMGPSARSTPVGFPATLSCRPSRETHGRQK